jgi:hypothetical protein
MDATIVDDVTAGLLEAALRAAAGYDGDDLERFCAFFTVQARRLAANLVARERSPLSWGASRTPYRVRRRAVSVHSRLTETLGRPPTTDELREAVTASYGDMSPERRRREGVDRALDDLDAIWWAVSCERGAVDPGDPDVADRVVSPIDGSSDGVVWEDLDLGRLRELVDDDTWEHLVSRATGEPGPARPAVVSAVRALLASPSNQFVLFGPPPAIVVEPVACHALPAPIAA